MTKLLPGGFGQLFPIVEVIISLHVEYIEKAARGTLASGSDAPSEEQALESVLRMFEDRHLEADKRALEEYMRARTWEWWQGYPERRLFSALLVRADLRKRRAGSVDERRRPTRPEGLRIARPLLSGIPDEITLDAEGEYESVARLLAALLSPPMGEPSPEELQRYTELAKDSPVFGDAVGHYYEGLENSDKSIFRPSIGWQGRAARRSLLRRTKMNVAPGNPVKPAILIRNLHIQFVLGLLKRVGVPPQGTLVSGCEIVGHVLGISKDGVKDILKMRFTEAMMKQSEALAIRNRLLGTTAEV